jgi:hypothetical protein
MFSPEIARMLLRDGAVLTVTFDGVQHLSMVQLLAPREGDTPPAAIPLAVYLRNHQTEVAARAFRQRKNSVISRVTQLTGTAPNLDNVGDEEALNEWIATQPVEISSALRMSSDNFRAHMRGINQAARDTAQQNQAPARASDAHGATQTTAENAEVQTTSSGKSE